MFVSADKTQGSANLALVGYKANLKLESERYRRCSLAHLHHCAESNEHLPQIMRTSVQIQWQQLSTMWYCYVHGRVFHKCCCFHPKTDRTFAFSESLLNMFATSATVILALVRTYLESLSSVPLIYSHLDFSCVLQTSGTSPVSLCWECHWYCCTRHSSPLFDRQCPRFWSVWKNVPSRYPLSGRSVLFRPCVSPFPVASSCTIPGSETCIGIQVVDGLLHHIQRRQAQVLRKVSNVVPTFSQWRLWWRGSTVFILNTGHGFELACFIKISCTSDVIC